MLAILARACVLASVVLAAVPQLLAQQVINFVDSGCEEIHRTFAPVNPRRSADEAIIPGQIVMQLDLKLSMKTRVVVTEYPDTATMALSARGVAVWLARYRRPSSPSVAFRFTHIVSHNQFLGRYCPLPACHSQLSSVIFMAMIAPTNLELALLTAAVLGFKHGFDYDHIAAISDITSVEADRRRAMRMALLYVGGHAATVAILGSFVILFQTSLPRAIDNWAERAVGLTLVVLGIYVIGTLFRAGTHAHPKSRAMLLVGAYRWVDWKIRELLHASKIERPREANWSYTKQSAFFIGVIHGLGAETPSQLLVFLIAANLGGVRRGFLGLGMFLAGLLLMNTLMTASAVGIFSLSASRHRTMQVATALTAAYSLIVGAIFLFGSATLLPPLGG